MDPTVMFMSGAVDGDTACVNITIINDDNFEGVHTFQVTIMGVAQSGLTVDVTTDRASVNIMDDEGELVYTLGP